MYTVYASTQKAAREAYAHLTGRPNKQKNTNINTNRKGEKTGGTNNDMCSASASGNTVLINLHYMYSLV